jgi:hypothetical protein
MAFPSGNDRLKDSGSRVRHPIAGIIKVVSEVQMMEVDASRIAANVKDVIVGWIHPGCQKPGYTLRPEPVKFSIPATAQSANPKPALLRTCLMHKFPKSECLSVGQLNWLATGVHLFSFYQNFSYPSTESVG